MDILALLRRLTGRVNNHESRIDTLEEGGGGGTATTNASQLTSGTLNDGRLSTNVTLQGNNFNGVSQLVKTTSGGKLPAIDGSLLTNLPIGGGTNLGWFDVTTYGANPNDDNDDTTAIQAAMDACVVAGGGVVYFPASRNINGYHYKISGALKTSSHGVNPNCQLEIPFVAASGSRFITLVLLGEYFPNFYTEGIADVQRTNNGCVLESTIQGTGTIPAVFGTAWDNAGVVGPRNYIHVHMENLIVRTSTMSGATNIAGTMSAINFAKLTSFTRKNIKTDISSVLSSSARPTNETYGCILPEVGNKTLLHSEGIEMYEGYKYGIELGEHTNIHQLETAGCEYGVKVPFGNAGFYIASYTCEVNRNNLLFAGSMDGVIGLYETEHYTSSDKWYQFQKDFAYSSGTSELTILRSIVNESFVGHVNNLVVDASAKLTVFNGAGANVNFTSSTITDLSAYTLYDDFNRSNSITTPGNLVKPSTTAWTVESGTWGIINNRLYEVTETMEGSTVFHRVVADPSKTDIDYSVTFRRNASSGTGAVIFRYVDPNNRWYLELSGALVLGKWTSNSFTSVGVTAFNFVVNTNYVIRITVVGNVINVYVDGILKITATDAYLNTATKVGLETISGGSNGGGVLWDDFKVI